MSLTPSFHNSNPPGTVTGMKQKSLNTVALFIDPKAMQWRMEKHFGVTECTGGVTTDQMIEKEKMKFTFSWTIKKQGKKIKFTIPSLNWRIQKGFLLVRTSFQNIRIPTKNPAAVLTGISGHFPSVLKVRALAPGCQVGELNGVKASPTRGIEAPHSYWST